MNYLDRNEFNFQPSQRVLDTFKKFDPEKLCFYTRIYDQGQKSIFSEYLSHRYGIPEQQILIGYGAEHLLKNAIHYFLTEDGAQQRILIPGYSWWYYKSIASEVKGITLEYPLYEDGDSFCYDISAMLKRVHEQKSKILLLATPNNPTGNCLSATQIKEILAGVPTQTIVLIDEAYAAFAESDSSYLAPMLAEHDNLIIVRSMSKFYGLPGLRLGYALIGKGERLLSFAKYSNMYLGYDRLSEELGIAAMESEDHYRKIANMMHEARKMYSRELGAIPGFKVYRSTANFVLVKYPSHLKTALQQALAQRQYQVKFMSDPGLEQHMRITLGREEQNRIVCDTITQIAKSA